MTNTHPEESIDGCRDPGTVTRDDLLARAAGQTDPRIAAHLSVCPACRAEAAAYARLDHALAATLFRADCPSAMTLGEVALELLSPEEATPVRAHAALCPHCAAELAEFVEVARTDPLIDGRPGPVRRILAKLLPAGAPRAAALALRGAADAGTRTYSADDITIVLSVGLESMGPPRRWSLVGLVLDQSGTGLPLEGMGRLSRGMEAIAEAGLDEIDGMTFTGLSKGVYTLELTLGDRIIVVNDVTVGDGLGP